MRIMGIVGGVASGKSLVAKRLEQLGAVILDADQVGHEVLFEEQVKNRIRARWGNTVFDATGEVSRAGLAERVFAPPPEGPSELKHLESIVHPRITERLRTRIDQWSSRGDVPGLVLDAAVMCEAGWDALCDKILFIDAPDEQRRARAAQRGWDEETWRAREDAQMSLDAKRERADIVVDNSGSAEETYRQLDQIWNQFVECSDP